MLLNLQFSTHWFALDRTLGDFFRAIVSILRSTRLYMRR